MIRLFRRDYIIRYRRGILENRRKGLRELVGCIRELPGLEPNAALCALLARDLGELSGESMKRFEELLEGLFWAYLTWYVWRWGAERNEVYGTLEEGDIVVPKAG
jgi:predicted RNase H-like nuclease